MTTLLAPSQSKTRTVYPKPFSLMETVHKEEEKEITATAEMVTYAPAPIHRDELPVIIARQIVAFYDWLSGPPLSDRDRIRSAIDEGRYDRYIYF